MFRKTSPKYRGIHALHLLAGLLAIGLSVPALGSVRAVPDLHTRRKQNATTGPTYPYPLANPWVASDGTIITPAGTQVYLGITTRAKAVALNPNSNHTAAVLQMGAPQAVTIFNTQTGNVLQTYSCPTPLKGVASNDSDGSHNGITYTPDGMHLLFSQDGSYGPTSYVAIANVNPVTGLLSDYTQVNVPLDVTS